MARSFTTLDYILTKKTLLYKRLFIPLIIAMGLSDKNMSPLFDCFTSSILVGVDETVRPSGEISPSAETRDWPLPAYFAIAILVELAGVAPASKRKKQYRLQAYQRLVF